MSDQKKKILEEEIMDGIPALALFEKGFAQCGMVLENNTIIVAYFTSKLLQFASAIRTPNYHIMKNFCDGFQHKPAAKILNHTHQERH